MTMMTMKKKRRRTRGSGNETAKREMRERMDFRFFGEAPNVGLRLQVYDEMMMSKTTTTITCPQPQVALFGGGGMNSCGRGRLHGRSCMRSVVTPLMGRCLRRSGDVTVLYSSKPTFL